MWSEMCDEALGTAWARGPAGQRPGRSGVLSPQPSSRQAPIQAPSSLLLLCLSVGKVPRGPVVRATPLWTLVLTVCF